jgi:CRISPR-associated protein Csc1
MPHIYRCTLRVLETTFFSTREVSDLYQTEPFIGHLALCYALGLAPVRYANDGTIHYQQDFAALNEQGIYVTPATLLNPRYTLESFNAQTEGYWSAMGNNTLVTVPPGGWAVRHSKSWYISDGSDKARKKGPENRPQFGRIRALAIGNRAQFFVVSERPQDFPRYLRLGKWMSKARLEAVEPLNIKDESSQGSIPFLLAAPDLPADMSLLAFDLLNVAPVPLVRAAVVQGPCYQLEEKIILPRGMKFCLEDSS